MRKPGARKRGAVLVETALSLIFLLGLFFAGFQIGLIGFYQLAMDEGNQINAHATALGYSPSQTSSIVVSSVPHLFTGSYPDPSTQAESGRPLPLPPAGNGIDGDGVDYGFSSTSARTGGYSFTAPLPYVSRTKQNSGLLQIGKWSVGVNSLAVEAQFRELCPHYCIIANGLSGATSTQDSVPYFTEGDNSPPYFYTFNFMQTCGASPDWDLTIKIFQQNEYTPDYRWDPCLPYQFVWRALGTAAHLDENNNFYLLPGEQLANSYRGLLQTPPAAGEAGPFFELWCHRNMYLWIEQLAFPQPYPQTPPWPNDSVQTNTWLKTWLQNDPNNPMPGAIIYNTAENRLSPPAGQTALAGWDAPEEPDGGNGAINFSGTPSPWWGCGAIP